MAVVSVGHWMRGLLCMLVPVTFCVNGQINLDMQLSPTTLYKGDSMEGTCVVQLESPERFRLEWFKRTYDGEEPGFDEQICVNGFVNDAFKPHYNCTIVSEEGNLKHTFGMVVPEMKASGRFEIGCRVPTATIEVAEQVTVYAPISEMKFVYSVEGKEDTCVLGDGEIMCSEGQDLGISCDVSGSYPVPIVDLFLEDKNITDEFSKVEVSVIDTSVWPGERTVACKVSMFPKNFKVDYLKRGQRLRCLARVPGTPFEEQSLDTILQMDGFKPKFQCKNLVPTSEHSPPPTVRCGLVSNPPANVYVSWVSADRQEHKLFPDQTAGNMALRLESKSTGPDGSEDLNVVLEFSDFSEEDMTEYFITASNDKGETQHRIRFDWSASKSHKMYSPMVSTLILLLLLVSMINRQLY